MKPTPPATPKSFADQLKDKNKGLEIVIEEDADARESAQLGEQADLKKAVTMSQVKPAPLKPKPNVNLDRRPTANFEAIKDQIAARLNAVSQNNNIKKKKKLDSDSENSSSDDDD